MSSIHKFQTDRAGRFAHPRQNSLDTRPFSEVSGAPSLLRISAGVLHQRSFQRLSVDTDGRRNWLNRWISRIHLFTIYAIPDCASLVCEKQPLRWRTTYFYFFGHVCLFQLLMNPKRKKPLIGPFYPRTRFTADTPALYILFGILSTPHIFDSNTIKTLNFFSYQSQKVRGQE